MITLYVCEPNLWTLDAPGYCEGDVMRDKWTDARCHMAPLPGPPAHGWGAGRWSVPVGGDAQAWASAWWVSSHVCPPAPARCPA